MKLLIGCHVSFLKDKQLLGCVEQTINYDGNCFMFYTGAPQNVTRGKIDDTYTTLGLNLMKNHNIDPNNIVVHAPYLINLANPKNQSFAVQFLKQEIKRCEELAVTKLVVHPGSHVGLGIEQGIKVIIDSLNKIITSDQKVIICLETMSGKGSECGHTFEQLKQIIDGIKHQDKIGICLDTCHLHDSGFNMTDFDKLLDNFDKVIGISKIKCIHLNDSKNMRGDKKDRHANIGLGNIGFDSLIKIIYNQRLNHVPKILETPYIADNDESNKKIYPPYKLEIEMIKNKKFNPQLQRDIRNNNQKTN